jgi:hypothetical protein
MSKYVIRIGWLRLCVFPRAHFLFSLCVTGQQESHAEWKMSYLLQDLFVLLLSIGKCDKFALTNKDSSIIKKIRKLETLKKAAAELAKIGLLCFLLQSASVVQIINNHKVIFANKIYATFLSERFFNLDVHKLTHNYRECNFQIFH